MSQTDDPRARIVLDRAPAPPKSLGYQMARVFFLLSLAGGALWGAFGPSRADRIADEARTYLAACTTDSCRDAESAFIADYQAAMDGDRPAQIHVFSAFFLGRPWIARNVLQACAWGLVAVAGDLAHADAARIADLDVLCAALGPDGHALARRRAEQLRATIGDAD